MKTFGDIIRKAREKKSLLLRQVASELGIDQAIICKLEKGERKPLRKQVQKFADFYQLNNEELLVAWLSDKVSSELKDEKVASEVLKAADVKIRHAMKFQRENMQQNNTIKETNTEHGSNERFKKLFYEGAKELKRWKPIKLRREGTVDVLDFFSGCGGMSLGFAAMSHPNTLYNIIGGIDINEIALKSFKKNFKAKTLCRDIREIYSNDERQEIKDYFGIEPLRENPLVIIGCAPCQGFSAHRKKNWHKDDDRNTLIGAFAEIVVSFDPDYIVMENVPDIFSKKYISHYQEAKNTFERNGYKISQIVYNAASFGVPQARHRAVIVASKNGFTLPPELLPSDKYLTVRDAIGNLPKVKPGEVLKNDYYHRCASHKQSTIDTISKVPPDGGSRPKGVGPKCLDKITGFSDVYGRLSWDKPAITITQYSRNPASGRFTHPVQNRGLTIREAARIQSFPDGFEFEGNLDDCFKQIGEAVPPLLSMVIAIQIAIDIDSNEADGMKKDSLKRKSKR